MNDDRRGAPWNINIREGDSYALAITPTDSSGAAVIVSEASADVFRDRVLVYTMAVSVDALSGEMLVTLTPADTEALGAGKFKWELKATIGASVAQWLTGELVIVAPGCPRTSPVYESASITIGDTSLALTVAGAASGEHFPGYYGIFFSEEDQNSVGGAETILYAENTSSADGVSYPSGQLTVDNAGVYNAQFVAQFHHRSGGGAGETIYLWLRINGVDVPDSAYRFVVPNGTYAVRSQNWMGTAQAGDYLEVVMVTDNDNIYLEHDDTLSPAIPHIASFRMTVHQVR